MKKGQLKGGKIATPVRDMLSSEVYNGVVFHCEDNQHAETTRLAALILRGRNNYTFNTHRNGKDLIVYKDGWDYEPQTFGVDISKRSKSKQTG